MSSSYILITNLLNIYLFIIGIEKQIIEMSHRVN